MLFASLFKSRRRSTVADDSVLPSSPTADDEGDKQQQQQQKHEHLTAAAAARLHHPHSTSHHSHPHTHHHNNHSRQSQPNVLTTTTTTTNYSSNRTSSTNRYRKSEFTMGVCFGSNKLGSVLAFLLSLLLVVLFGYVTFDIWRRDDGQLLQSWDNFKRSLTDKPFYGIQFILLLTFAMASLMLSIILLLGIIKRRPSYLLIWSVMWFLVLGWLVVFTGLLIYDSVLRYGTDGSHRSEVGTEKFWTLIIHIAVVAVVTLLAIWAWLGVLAFRNDLKFSRQEEYVQVATVG